MERIVRVCLTLGVLIWSFGVLDLVFRFVFGDWFLVWIGGEEEVVRDWELREFG